MDNQNKSFMDPGTLKAVVVIFVLMIGWQFYMGKKYPAKPVSSAEVSKTQPTEPTSVSAPAAPGNTSLSAPAPTVTETVEKPVESLDYFEDEKWAFTISSLGMGIKDVKLKDFKGRDGQTIVIGAGQTPYSFSTVSRDETLQFAMKKIAPDTFEGIANHKGSQIKKIVKVNSRQYSLDTKLFISSAKGLGSIETRFFEKKLPHAESSIFSPALDHQTSFAVYGNKSTNEMLKADKPVNFSYQKISIAGLASHYFGSAIVDNSRILPDLKVFDSNQAGFFEGTLFYPVSEDTVDLEYVAFVGPKSLSILTSIHPDLKGILDFGFFSSIAFPLLKIMKWLYEIFANYGLAIIMLTIMVRVLVLPFNLMSYKSMKAMQAIQPQMQAIRTKYKEDPQKMNTEVMSLMRESKVNPLGGCLPMLLQLPIFFALYRVLGNSIELYQAPFMLWIHDLSLKDPFYVLPILMGVTMFIQQKITPTTMDPAQAKIMLFMPVLFSFLMISLPSGLTLYIFVSTLFAILQQKFFMREAATQTTSIRAEA